MKKRMNDESTVREQYADASKLNARIALHKKHTVAEEGFYEWAFRHLQLESGMNVLEIGCGSGALWQHGGQIPEGTSLTLTDMNEGMLNETQVALAGIVPAGTRFLQANAMDLPFEDERFDLVVMHHVLHHVPDIDGAIQSVYRVLKPGGHMTTTTTGEDTMTELYALMDAATGGPVAIPDMAFTMENGAEYLKRAFDRVERFEYPSHLLVTDADDLIAYMDSMMVNAKLDDGARAKVREAVACATRERNGLYIRKSTGMFRAWK